MKKFSLVLAAAAFAWLQPQAAAQTPPSVQVVPCPSEATPGRPVLKRRAPESDSQATPQPQSSTSNQQPCNTIVNTNGSNQTAVEIRLEGLINVPESDVRQRLREHRLIPTSDSIADTGAVAKADEGLRQILFDYGYRCAQVSSRIEQRNQESPVLVFLIVEGPRFTLSEIRFDGNHVFPSQLLVSKTKSCVSGFHKDDPDRFDSQVLEYCLYSLANFERSQGYLRARFSEPKVEEVGTGLIITVHANEDVLYRLGRLEIEGADHIAERYIREMLDMQTGDIANGERLAKTFYEDLKATYGEKGFIQYTAEIQPEFRADVRAGQGVVDLEITIEEGPRFQIRKIGFSGEKLAQTDLRELLLVREGGVYNQKLFEQSIDRLNDLGWFEFVDKDKDVDYRTNEEEHLVDIVIKLTKKIDS